MSLSTELIHSLEDSEDLIEDLQQAFNKRSKNQKHDKSKKKEYLIGLV